MGNACFLLPLLFVWVNSALFCFALSTPALAPAEELRILNLFRQQCQYSLPQNLHCFHHLRKGLCPCLSQLLASLSSLQAVPVNEATPDSTKC